MTHSPDVSRASSSRLVLGFLTVVRNETHGLFGGYLLLNNAGRPLEFHCTTPVKASRAQEILFGPTLEPYLLGEQIGRALVEKSKCDVQVICTDIHSVLSLRPFIDRPLVCVAPGEQPQGTAERAWRLDPPHGAGAEPLAFRLGAHTLALARGFEHDREPIEQALGELVSRFTLDEPFSRIREAIDEAQRSGR